MRRRDFIKAGASGACAVLLGCGSDAAQAPAPDGSAGPPDGGPGGGPGGVPGGEPGGVPPPTIDPRGPRQFLTWDGGSGPGSVEWDHHLKLPWKSAGGTGDYLDAAQVAKGETPYATAEVSGPGAVSLDVGPLVKRWLETNENRGFYLRSNQAYAWTFVGREGAEGQRPVLEVETSEGTFHPPCLANAHWTPSSTKSFDTRAKFTIGGQYRTIVLFDLSEVRGTLVRATLTMTASEATRKGVLSVFEADPPIFRVGGGNEPPRTGIAAGYHLDKGLEAHSSVLFVADFSDTTPAGGWSGRATSSTKLDDPEAESVAIRGMFRAGSTGSCDLTHAVVRGTTVGSVPDHTETELYARYYVYLEADWGSTVDANKMPGFDCRMGWWNPAQGGYWQSTTGNGGSPGTGLKVRDPKSGRWVYEGHSLRGLGGSKENDGNYYDDLFYLGGYIYNLDQAGAFGAHIPWTGTVLAKERWTCIEQYVKMNTITGPFDELGNGTAVADGVYRVWVDGVLCCERTGLRWTRHPELGLQGFWLNWYHGGTQPPVKDMHYRMNSVVIAREYIGPQGGRTPPHTM